MLAAARIHSTNCGQAYGERRRSRLRAPAGLRHPPTRGASSRRRPSSSRSCASVSFLLVNVVDPFSGATASPDFALDGERFGGAEVQAFDVEGDYTIDVGEGGLRRREEARGQARAGLDVGVQRLGASRDHPRSRIGTGVRRRCRRGTRLALDGVRLPRRALEQGVRLARERLQRVERRLRHPAGPAGFEDGNRRRRLGDERRRRRSSGASATSRVATARRAAPGRTRRTSAGTDPPVPPESVAAPPRPIEPVQRRA